MLPRPWRRALGASLLQRKHAGRAVPGSPGHTGSGASMTWGSGATLPLLVSLTLQKCFVLSQPRFLPRKMGCALPGGCPECLHALRESGCLGHWGSTRPPEPSSASARASPGRAVPVCTHAGVFCDACVPLQPASPLARMHAHARRVSQTHTRRLAQRQPQRP